MKDANDYRTLAAACRRAANLSRRPVPYLLRMAEDCERRAAQLDASFAGQKPGPLQAHDMRQEKPRL
jgi:hypothetical protein